MRSLVKSIGTGMAVVLIAITSVSAQAPTAMCAVDMGSNSFRRIVGSFADGRYRELRIESRTLGVGDEVTRLGRIGQPKMMEIEQALTDFRQACRAEGMANIVAVGTAAFRESANGLEVVALAERLGIRMEIASEQRESELAYLVGSLGRDDYAVIDNGSRSIELVAQTGGDLRFSVFNLGYRLAWEEYFASAADPAAAIEAFAARLRPYADGAPFMRGRQALIGVEFEEMAAVLFDPAPAEGRQFTAAELRRRLDDIAGRRAEFASLKQRKDIDRALPRLVTAVTLLDAFGYSSLELTSRQLGAGLIVEAGLKR
jgi:exopolyphosphatase/pppGpp-phosphohydrolase